MIASAREWITRPAAERAAHEAAGWRFEKATIRTKPGEAAEPVVIMSREIERDLFATED